MTATLQSTNQIDIQRACDATAPDDQALTDWALRALAHIGLQGDLTIRLVDSDEIQALNRDYRGKDYATNVLSFPFDMPEGMDEALNAGDEDFAPEADYLGDLAICAEVVVREAAEQGKTETAHWAHMVVHGTLHLAGYDHIDEGEAEEMEALERAILHQAGFPDPYLIKED